MFIFLQWKFETRVMFLGASHVGFIGKKVFNTFSCTVDSNPDPMEASTFPQH